MRAYPRSAKGSCSRRRAAAPAVIRPAATSSSKTLRASASTSLSCQVVPERPAGERVGYLGPPGTFTEQALLSQGDLADAELVDLPSIPDVLRAVEAGVVDLGFVPIENAIDGTVRLAQDAIAFHHDLLIQREVVLDVEQCLMARPGTELRDIKAVVSIPVATAQCNAFLERELPGVEQRAANSTAEAARAVGSGAEGGVAAIGPQIAAELYGLAVIARDIADHDGNQT